ncbi:MAG: hypothetical protein KAT06_07340 [Gammaproteobacteria bacterium]|nr:hypothetical protein [Gammaproteobacteria bacterium]
MNSSLLKLILFSCIIFQTSCDITFKRKVEKEKKAPVVIDEQLKSSIKVNGNKETGKSANKFTKNDFELISSYYSDKTNSIIRKDMIMHTQISREQTKKLVVDEYVPGDVQVMPLPLKLNRNLSVLLLDKLRVQIGTRVILMNVKTRRILDIIKI